MSLPTPSTAQIATNIRNQLEASLGQAIPFLPKAALNVLAVALAGVFILIWKYASWIFLQLFVARASTAEVTINGVTLVPLVEWGRLFGLGDPYTAGRAIVDARVTVVQQGGYIAAGAQVLRSPTGVIYRSTQRVDLDAPEVTIRLRASTGQGGADGSGAIGNLSPGDELSFVSPLPGVARVLTVLAQVVTADDGETWEAYRARILEFVQARPQGGAYADYRAWARTVPGIVGVYPRTGAPGEVEVFCLATVASSGDPDGVPTPAQLEAVAEAIELDVDGLASRRPVTAAVFVFPITRLPFDVNVYGLDGPAGLQDQVSEAITSYYLDREPYILGLTPLPAKNRVLESSLVAIVDDLCNSVGGTFGSVEQFAYGAETPTFTLSVGDLAKLGTLTFI